MRLKNKIKLGATALVCGVAAGVLLNKTLDNMVKTHLSRDGITHPKTKLLSKKNQEDFASSPEVLLGQIFYATAPQINITIPNREGRQINALLYKQDKEEQKYAIIVHGYRSSTKAISYLARRYYEAGYNVLCPYLRAHAGSDYEWSTMGWHERFDIIDWINYIEEKSVGAKIVLHGVSMGAATVMMTTGESLPSSVICAIEDCGYTSVYDAYSYKIPQMMHLPAFPSINIFRRAIINRVGFDIKEASALAQIRKSCTPTLFLHGEADTVVPVSMARELYENARCEKDILIFPRAEHAMSPLNYPDKYWGKVWEFIAKHEQK